MATAGEIAALSQAKAAADIGEYIYDRVEKSIANQHVIMDLIVTIKDTLAKHQQELYDSMHKEIKNLRAENNALHREITQLRHELQEQRVQIPTR